MNGNGPWGRGSDRPRGCPASRQGAGNGVTDEGCQLGNDPGHQVRVVIPGGGDRGNRPRGNRAGGTNGGCNGDGTRGGHGTGPNLDKVLGEDALLLIAVDTGSIGHGDQGPVGIDVAVFAGHIGPITALLVGQVGLLVVIGNLVGIGVDWIGLEVEMSFLSDLNFGALFQKIKTRLEIQLTLNGPPRSSFTSWLKSESPLCGMARPLTAKKAKMIN